MAALATPPSVAIVTVADDGLTCGRVGAEVTGRVAGRVRGFSGMPSTGAAMLGATRRALSAGAVLVVVVVDALAFRTVAVRAVVVGPGPSPAIPGMVHEILDPFVTVQLKVPPAQNLFDPTISRSLDHAPVI